MIKSSSLLLGAGVLVASLGAPLAAYAEHDDGSLSVLIGTAVGQVLAHDDGYRVRLHRRHQERHHDHRRWRRDHKDFHKHWERAHRRYHTHAERDHRRNHGRRLGWDRGRGHDRDRGYGHGHGHGKGHGRGRG